MDNLIFHICQCSVAQYWSLHDSEAMQVFPLVRETCPLRLLPHPLCSWKVGGCSDWNSGVSFRERRGDFVQGWNIGRWTCHFGQQICHQHIFTAWFVGVEIWLWEFLTNVLHKFGWFWVSHIQAYSGHAVGIWKLTAPKVHFSDICY